VTARGRVRHAASRQAEEQADQRSIGRDGIVPRRQEFLSERPVLVCLRHTFLLALQQGGQFRR
jgi:hypothetical protein